MPNPDALCPGSIGEGRDAGKCDGWCAATCQSGVYPSLMSGIATKHVRIGFASWSADSSCDGLQALS